MIKNFPLFILIAWMKPFVKSFFHHLYIFYVMQPLLNKTFTRNPSSKNLESHRRL